MVMVIVMAQRLERRNATSRLRRSAPSLVEERKGKEREEKEKRKRRGGKGRVG